MFNKMHSEEDEIRFSLFKFLVREKDPRPAWEFQYVIHKVDGEPETINVVSGQARIRFGSHDYGPNDWDESRQPGSAIVFFETDNVEGIHAAVRARGGRPSDLENVNAIKMRVFEIRDPDGHTLWFGQSFDEPDTPAPRGLEIHDVGTCRYFYDRADAPPKAVAPRFWVVGIPGASSSRAIRRHSRIR